MDHTDNQQELLNEQKAFKKLWFYTFLTNFELVEMGVHLKEQSQNIYSLDLIYLHIPLPVTLTE